MYSQAGLNNVLTSIEERRILEDKLPKDINRLSSVVEIKKISGLKNAIEKVEKKFVERQKNQLNDIIKNEIDFSANFEQPQNPYQANSTDLSSKKISKAVNNASANFSSIGRDDK